MSLCMPALKELIACMENTEASAAAALEKQF